MTSKDNKMKLKESYKTNFSSPNNHLELSKSQQPSLLLSMAVLHLVEGRDTGILTLLKRSQVEGPTGKVKDYPQCFQ